MFKIAAVATGMLFSASLLPALAQTATVDTYTPAQERAARAALGRAGFAPGSFWVQAGNFFFTATKGSQTYGVTVTPSGEVYPSGPMT